MGGGHRSGAAHLTEVLASCHDFLVDDCGREVGVVEGVDVDPDSAAPERLRVVQGWGRRRTTISIDEVIEVTPGERRLVIACRDGHDLPQAGPPRTKHGSQPIWRGSQVADGAAGPPPNRAGATPRNPQREVLVKGFPQDRAWAERSHVRRTCLNSLPRTPRPSRGPASS